MSRKIIIGLLVVLILGIVGGTVALIVQRLRSDTAPGPTDQTTNPLVPSDTGQQQVVNPDGDDDADGLSNADEALWGTSPSVADTDGDGFLDGEEVAANHNPTIAGPNDLLPEGFTPGQDLTPLAAAPLSVDQFFADNLDLTGGNRNLTEAYQNQYSEDERTPSTLAEFTQSQPIITQLPRPRQSAIDVSGDNSSISISSYIAVAGTNDVLSNKTLLDNALNGLIRDNDPSGARAMASRVRLYQEDLLSLRVPPAAENLHRLLLGYTELVAATFDQMTLWNDDPLKAILAMRQLETIDSQYYPLITSGFTQLQNLTQ